MNTTFEDAGAAGRDFLDSSMKSLASVSKTAQAIVSEATDYTKSSYETGAAAMEKLLGAKSIEAAVEIQSAYAKTAYEAFVAEAGKIGGLYADMAKEAYKPFEAMIAKAKH